MEAQVRRGSKEKLPDTPLKTTTKHPLLSRAHVGHAQLRSTSKLEGKKIDSWEAPQLSHETKKLMKKPDGNYTATLKKNKMHQKPNAKMEKK